MIDLRTLALTPDNILSDATIPELPNHYRGKVRDNYDLPGDVRILIASDRVSAFDRNLAAIPFKGQVLTQIARFWFEATRDICPNHVIEYPDPNVVVGRRLDMLPVEMVVRDYLAGTTSTSILSMYRKGERRLYGVTFPDGMRDNQKLDHTIITPTTKAPQSGHDEPLTPARHHRAGAVDARPVGGGVGAGIGAVRARPRDRGAARADPGGYQIRIRLRPRRPYRAGGRNPHPRQQPLLDGGQLPAPLRGRRTPRKPR